MGSRLQGMRGGGGFLNNTDGMLVDYEFTNAFPGQDAPEDPEIFGILTIRPDGGDPVQTTLRFGSGLYLEIADQHTLVNPEGSPARIWDKSDGYRFLESVEEAGVPDGGIDASDVDRLSFKGLIGRRMRFVQEKDESRMEALRKAGKNPKRTDKKTGKEYDYTRLIVEAVYDSPVQQTVMKTTPKATGKTPVKVVAKAAPAKSGDASGDVDGEVATILRKIIADNGGQVMRSDLTRLMTTELLATKNPRREVIRKRAYQPEFLTAVEGVEFDEVGQTISVA